MREEMCHRCIMNSRTKLSPYPSSLAGTLLAAREAVMAPIRPRLRAANVTEQQWRVLRVLEAGDEMDARSVAAAALLYPPSVTRILKELGERKLIDRHTDPQDGRRLVVFITNEGRALVENTATDTLQLLTSYGRAFGEERLDNLRKEIIAFTKAIAPFAPEE